MKEGPLLNFVVSVSSRNQCANFETVLKCEIVHTQNVLAKVGAVIKERRDKTKSNFLPLYTDAGLYANKVEMQARDALRNNANNNDC